MCECRALYRPPYRIYPYAYYFCRKQCAGGCGCTSLDYPFTKHYRACDKCEHSPLSHYCW